MLRHEKHHTRTLVPSRLSIGCQSHASAIPVDCLPYDQLKLRQAEKAPESGTLWLPSGKLT